MSDEDFKEWFEINVKDSVEDELIDALIRILELFHIKNADPELHINLKNEI